MTTIINVTNINNTQQDYHLNDSASNIIDGSELLALPSLIDPHVHFRVPGMEHKEDWITGSNAAFRGG